MIMKSFDLKNNESFFFTFCSNSQRTGSICLDGRFWPSPNQKVKVNSTGIRLKKRWRWWLIWRFVVTLVAAVVSFDAITVCLSISSCLWIEFEWTVLLQIHLLHQFCISLRTWTDWLHVWWAGSGYFKPNSASIVSFARADSRPLRYVAVFVLVVVILSSRVILHALLVVRDNRKQFEQIFNSVLYIFCLHGHICLPCFHHQAHIHFFVI